MLQKATRRLPGTWSGTRTTLLVVAGFSAIDYGVFQWNTIAGWIAAGVSCLVIEGLSDNAEGGERE